MTVNKNECVRSMLHNDLDLVLTWRNHPTVRKFMYTNHKISEEEHLSWYERAVSDPERRLLIFEIDNMPTGFVNLHEIAVGKTADWGFYLAPDAPPGAGQKMGVSALEHAFSIEKFHKICGQAIAFNERSSAFHLKLGFHQEGVLRQQHFDGTDYHDVTCFGLLADEWMSNREIQS